MEANYCAKCGTKISKNTNFCGNCGEKINEQEIVNASSTPNTNKNKGGILRTLGKVALWGFAIVILGIVALYIIGDSIELSETTEEQVTDGGIERLSKEEMTMSPRKVRQANPVLSNTSSFKIFPTGKKQEIRYSDKIKITTPPNFANQEESLAISNVTIDEAIMVEDAQPLLLVDLTLDNEKQPAKPLEISYTYNKADLNPNFTAEEQLAAFRWDEEGGGWIILPIRLEENNQSISLMVDHFSFISVVKLLMNEYYKGPDGNEKIMNSIYTTPEKNFRILYSSDGIEDNEALYDKGWKMQYVRPGYNYTNDHPRYVQDIGYFLESALKKYTNPNTYGFKSPTKNEMFLNMTYHKSLVVKIDSWFSKASDYGAWPEKILDKKNPLTDQYVGLPSYEKIYERLHIPTNNARGLDMARITTAHELFHAIQAEYYGILGMFNPKNLWWHESTADYAAFSIAWPEYQNDMDDGLGSNYLSFPVNETGVKEDYGWEGRDYEYLTSIWIKYLVDNRKFDFKEMIVDDASDYIPYPIIGLENYSRKKQNLKLDDVYRDFAKWMTFSSISPLKRFPLASFDTGKNDHIIATKRNKLSLGSGEEITHYFEMPGPYCSKLWAIKLTKDPLDKKNNKKPLIIEIKSQSTGNTVEIYVVEQDKKYATPPKPLKTIYIKDKPVIVFAKPNDLLLIAATQGSLPESHAEVMVKDAGIILEIDPAELSNVRPREANDFTITAKNIPKEIKNVSFEWDYSDGSDKGIHDFVTVSNGEAKQKISHRYKESDKEEIYPLKVILKEAGKNTILSEAEALVTLPLAKPVLSVTPGIAVGPPGETFDMEAKAYPRNTYKFVWEISGFGETFTQEGEMSGIAPIIDEEGEYSVTVKLYDLAGNYLNKALASISVEPDELDTEGVDGIVGIDEEEKPFTHSGYWVLYDTKSIDGCQFYESECWPLESCTGSAGSYSISIGSSTCGSNASGYSGFGTYTVPPSKLIPGETLTFEVTASGSGYCRVDVSYYENINKMSFDESGNNTGESSSWNRKIIGCYADASPSTGEYKIPENNNLGGALLIDGGGSMGTKTTYRHYFFLYKWQK
jgi:hypothetical protein